MPTKKQLADNYAYMASSKANYDSREEKYKQAFWQYATENKALPAYPQMSNDMKTEYDKYVGSGRIYGGDVKQEFVQSKPEYEGDTLPQKQVIKTLDNAPLDYYERLQMNPNRSAMSATTVPLQPTKPIVNINTQPIAKQPLKPVRDGNLNKTYKDTELTKKLGIGTLGLVNDLSLGGLERAVKTTGSQTGKDALEEAKKDTLLTLPSVKSTSNPRNLNTGLNGAKQFDTNTVDVKTYDVGALVGMGLSYSALEKLAGEGLIKISGKLVKPLTEAGMRALKGAIAGGAQMGITDVNEGKSLKETAIDTGIGFALGGLVDVALGKLKLGKALTAEETNAVQEAVKKNPDLLQSIREQTGAKGIKDGKIVANSSKNPLMQSIRGDLGITPNGGDIKINGQPMAKPLKPATLEPVKPLESAKPLSNTNALPMQNNAVEVKPVTKGKLPQLTIDTIAEDAANWTDKKQKLAYKRETMDRNFTDIIPDKEKAKQMNDTFIEPIRQSEAESIRNINQMRDEAKGLNIKAFSKESELVQKFGEGKMTYDELKVHTKDPEKIVKAADYFRKKYDELLVKANAVLKANGYSEIPRRPNYFPHQGEIETLMQKIGIENQDLPTDINGLTDMFVPGKNFFRNALQRKGDKTAFDAIRGFDSYVEGINKIIYHTPNIKRIRQLEKALRDKYEGTTHLTNFVSELRDYGNILAGKQSKLDRGMEEVVGRQVYKTADTIRKQLGANMVGGNVSSALTNFIPITQALGSTDKASFAQAMVDTITNVLKDDGFVNKSDYLVRRFGSDRLALTAWQKTGQMANWLFKVVDGFSSQVITRAKYLEGIKKGLSEEVALKESNNYAAKVMADRSVGQIPTLFASKTLAPLSMFQIEVNNQISHLFKDLPREFTKNKAALASAYAQIGLYSYLFNNLYETATGRRPAFDVIGVAQKTIQDYNNDELGKGTTTKNLIQNVANQLPFTSAITGGRIPLNSALPSLVGIATGQKDPKKELMKPVFNLMLPTGGSQINKTIQGLNTYNKGGAYNNNGTQIKHPVSKTNANLARSAIFGQYATPESQEYYNNDRKPLSEKQTDLYKKSINQGKDGAEVYNTMLLKRKEDGIKLEISNIRKSKSMNQEQKNEAIKKLTLKIKELNKK